MLVLRPGALGDTLLAVPALRALRRAHLPVTLAAYPAATRLLVRLNEVDRGLPFDHPSLGTLFSDESSFTEDVVAWTSTPVRCARIQAPSRPSNIQHCARYLLSTLAPLGIELAYEDGPLAIEPIISEEVLIHPGSGSPEKNWPIERFVAVTRSLAVPVRLVVGEADHALSRHSRSSPPAWQDAARISGMTQASVTWLGCQVRPPLRCLGRLILGCGHPSDRT